MKKMIYLLFKNLYKILIVYLCYISLAWNVIIISNNIKNLPNGMHNINDVLFTEQLNRQNLIFIILISLSLTAYKIIFDDK